MKLSFGSRPRFGMIAAGFVALVLAACHDVTAPIASPLRPSIAPRHDVATGTQGLRYFGYYEPISASFVKGRGNVYIARNDFEINQARANGLKIIYSLDVNVLNLGHSATAWYPVVDALQGKFQQGELVAFYIDEPYLTFSDSGSVDRPTLMSRLTALATRLKQYYPGTPFAIVEGYQKVDANWHSPDSVDWVGFDCPGFAPTWHKCESSDPAAPPIDSLLGWLRAGMNPGQKIILVPNASYLTKLFSGNDPSAYADRLLFAARQGVPCDNNPPTCEAQNELVTLANSYDSVAVSDSNVVAMLVYTGRTFTTGGEEDPTWIGAFDMPMVLAKYDSMSQGLSHDVASNPLPAPTTFFAASQQVFDGQHRGQPVSANPGITVTDGSNGVPGVNVVCKPSDDSQVDRRVVATGNASLEASNATRGSAGFIWTLGSLPAHAYTLSCRVPLLPTAAPVVFTAWSDGKPLLFPPVCRDCYGGWINDEGRSGGSFTILTQPPNAPVVQLLDEQGAPINGVTITCDPKNGSTVSYTTRVTGADGPGQAAFVWTMGPNPGPMSLECTAPPQYNASFVFNATAVSPEHTYHFAAPNGTEWNSPAVLVNTPTQTNPYVQLLDESGNAINGVTATCTPGNGSTVSWSTRQTGTDGAGMAAFIWTMPSAPGPVSMTCSTPDPYAASFTFHATARAMSYHFERPNGSSWSNVPVNASTPGNPYVQLLDENNSAVPGVTVTCSPSGGSTLSWPTRTTGTDGSGMAAFIWTMPSTPGSFSLSCSAPAPYSVSTAFSASAVSPYHFEFPNGTAWTASANSYTPGNPYVQLFDGSSTVPDVTISCTPSSGSSILWGSRVTGTDGPGMAAFVWSVGGTGSYSLTCTAPAPYNLSYTFHATVN